MQLWKNSNKCVKMGKSSFNKLNNEKYNWSISRTWSIAWDSYYFFSDPDNGYMQDVLTIWSAQGVKEASTCGVQKGDLLYWVGSDINNVNPHHAAIVVDVEYGGEIYYAGHSKEREREALSEHLDGERVKVIKIRDAAIRGYIN